MPEPKFHMPTKLAFDADTASGRYTRFICQPFERGWATTVGNALRRILLSSVPGAAISAVKMGGVLHEFSTIPGVQEDVTHIVLNLKKIPIILHGDEPRLLHLKAAGQQQVRAGHFDADSAVTLVDPACPIATLDADGELEMWCRVRPGRGYVSAEDNKEDELDVHYVCLDSIHSPVKKVNFRVSPARVGRVSTFEKMEIEIWTNGAVTPPEALQYAAGLLNQHVDLFKLEPEPAGEVKRDDEPLMAPRGLADDPLDRPVDELDISTRAINCLKNANIDTLKKLVSMTEDELKEIKNLGRKSVDDIVKALETLGFALQAGKGE
jgi:DNA-directed RNA polymerase subunit alpha